MTGFDPAELARLAAEYRRLTVAAVSAPLNGSARHEHLLDLGRFAAINHDRIVAAVTRAQETEKAIERVQEAVVVAHAHRLDHEGTEEEATARLWSVGVREPIKGGPDSFYSGVNFALRRIRAALGGATTTTGDKA